MLVLSISIEESKPMIAMVSTSVKTKDVVAKMLGAQVRRSKGEMK